MTNKKPRTPDNDFNDLEKWSGNPSDIDLGSLGDIPVPDLLGDGDQPTLPSGSGVLSDDPDGPPFGGGPAPELFEDSLASFGGESGSEMDEKMDEVIELLRAMTGLVTALPDLIAIRLTDG